MKKINSLLIVDDDKVSNLITSMAFAEVYAHTHITLAEDGKQALEAIKDCLEKQVGCPDMIFLDVNMPVMDGFEFLEQLEQLNKNRLPVVMLTSAMHTRHTQNMSRYKVTAMLEKPLTEEKIKKLLLTMNL